VNSDSEIGLFDQSTEKFLTRTLLGRAVSEEGKDSCVPLTCPLLQEWNSPKKKQILCISHVRLGEIHSVNFFDAGVTSQHFTCLFTA
jgi:hypothetical protein